MSQCAGYQHSPVEERLRPEPIYSLILLKRASLSLEKRHGYAASLLIFSPVVLGQPTFDGLVEEPLRIVCFKLAVTL